MSERIGREVARELRRFGPQAGMAEVVEAWPGAVGEAIARNAWPARITRDGTLVVHAADSVWAFELAQRAEEIASRLGLKRAKFVPGPLPEAAAEEAAETASSRVEPGPQHRAAAATLVAGIDDDELRELVARAAAASLARAPSDRAV